MDTNKTLVNRISTGSFKFPLQLDILGEHQKIQNAVFDTGCSHSLISVSNLILKVDTKNFQH